MSPFGDASRPRDSASLHIKLPTSTVLAAVQADRDMSIFPSFNRLLQSILFSILFTLVLLNMLCWTTFATLYDKFEEQEINGSVQNKTLLKCGICLWHFEDISRRYEHSNVAAYFLAHPVVFFCEGPRPSVIEVAYLRPLIMGISVCLLNLLWSLNNLKRHELYFCIQGA